ncbi:PKD domain-containing protein [Parapedobacter sp. 10938]|uniref:PKD domain-containing protein n=1 Tax=Parapedobacter flavus TaxID=3110225 RepID=UPI002DBB3333|nr:PKD domain-containing protein [Parapedobacter sp. 10938]MEC3881114.1 PKD domain-containing protein [Parapedobacter sp. 10938]
MNTKIFIGWALLALIIWGCSDKEVIEPPKEEEPKPTADFSFGQVSEDDPFTFKFDNASTNFAVSRWEFGDDSTSINESPTHTFLKTGVFNVKLRTENNDGYWAQREVIINLPADSLLKLNASSGDPGFMSLSYNAVMPLQEVRWFAGADTSEFITAGPSVDVAVESGRLDDLTLKGTTANGSVVVVYGQVTDLGLVRDVTNEANLTVSRDNSNGRESGEGSPKLIDNNTETKFLQFDYVGDLWCELGFYEPVAISGYSMTSANDADGRDPLNWNLEGSNDGETWVTLDVREGEDFPERFQTRTFLFNNTTPYLVYRLNITEVNSGSLFQLAEWRVLSFQN